MDITTEVSMDEFELGLDGFDDFGDFGDDLYQSTEMIELEIQRRGALDDFPIDLDD